MKTSSLVNIFLATGLSAAKSTTSYGHEAIHNVTTALNSTTVASGNGTCANLNQRKAWYVSHHSTHLRPQNTKNLPSGTPSPTKKKHPTSAP